MTKVDLGPSYTAENYEADNLCRSPIACAVADAWLNETWLRARGTTHEAFVAALDALESATRESPLRKVKP